MARKPQKKLCLKCLKEKNMKSEFYLSYSKWHGDGKLPFCKSCLKEDLDEDNEKSVKNLMRIIDKPYRYASWESARESDKDTFGTYLKDLALNYKYDTWEDSVFHPQEKNINMDYDEDNFGVSSNPKDISDEIIDKWGVGYTPQEYDAFERKYNVLKNNYQEKTAMHTEALLTYIRYRVKEELATSKGEVREAKEWGQLASKAANDAKINPSQLSKSDLSDGLDTFGQLVRTVEQSEDIIPILPQFKERPHDKPDFTMLCYINYIRDLKGLPLADYSDVYQFYEDRKKEQENQFDFLTDEEGED